jgi:hypothetical protein
MRKTRRNDRINQDEIREARKILDAIPRKC